jgi:hypothetical protein
MSLQVTTTWFRIASSKAMACPIPREPPVTIATGLLADICPNLFPHNSRDIGERFYVLFYYIAMAKKLISNAHFHPHQLLALSMVNQMKN